MRIPFVLASLLLLPATLHAVIIQNGDTITGGKTATSPDETYSPASNLTDNNLNNGVGGEWLPLNINQPITVDLGQIYRLSDLNLLNAINGGDRATGTFTVQVSTTGAFAGEQGNPASGTLQAKALGFQDIPLPAYNLTANNQNLVARYIRITPTSAVGFGPGLTAITANGNPNTGTGTVYYRTADRNLVQASAYTRTPFLADTTPASYSLSLVTPTGASTLQSLGKTVTLSNNEYPGVGHPQDITDGANGGFNSELLWDGNRLNDLSFGWAQVDLGQKILIDRIDLLNSTNFNDRGTKDYLIWVSNDPTFADANATEILSGSFGSLGAFNSTTLATPVLGQYVRFISSTYFSNGPGLDELSVYGRTVSTTLLASGTTQLGDSSTLANLALSSALPNKDNLLSLTVTPATGWSTSNLFSVEVVPEPATLGILTAGALTVLCRRRKIAGGR